MLIGLTGGIASGKTTCTNYLHHHHRIPIIDADIIARDVVKPGEEGLQKLVAFFGTDIIASDGSLNRAQLRAMISENRWVREQVNMILHPLIHVRLMNAAKHAERDADYCILSVPLLFENNLNKLVLASIVVDIPEEEQLRRLLVRDGTTEEQARGIMQAQITREKRLVLANYIVDNSGTLNDTYRQIEAIHQALLLLK